MKTHIQISPVRIFLGLAALYWLAFPAFSFCQNPELDSLRMVVSTAEKDTHQVHRLLRFSQIISNTDQDSGILMAEHAAELAGNLDFANGLALSLNQLGFVFNYRRELRQADSILNRALELESRLSNYPSTLARIYKNLGKVRRYEGRLDEAESLYLTALELAGKEKLGVQKAVIFNDLGDVFDAKGNPEKGTEYKLRAIDFFKQNGNLQNVAIGYLNIALAFKEVEEYRKALGYAEEGLGYAEQVGNPMLSGWANRVTADVLFHLEKYEQALEKAEPAAGYFRQLKNEYEYAKTTHLIGAIQHGQGYFEAAGQYFAEAKTTLEKGSDKASLAWLYINISENELAIERTNAALRNAKAAHEIAEKIGDSQLLLDSFEALEKAHLALGNDADAYRWLTKKTAIRDTIFEEGKRKALLQVETEYQVREKENQLTAQAAELALSDVRLSRQRLLLWGAALVLFLLGGFAFFVWKTGEQRRRTNRILAEQTEELKSLDRAKSRFFTNISHELRTPLQLVLAPLDLAAQKNKNRVVGEELDLARLNGKRLLSLVNEILDLSKLESGKMELRETPVEVKPLFKRLFFAHQSLVQMQGLTVDFECDLPDGLWTSLDVDKLEKIVNNLLSNAIKHSPSGGVVSMKIIPLLPDSYRDSEGEGMSVEVADQGQGIPPEEQAKIFERFYQVSHENEPMQGGTGVGLALSRELAHLLGGDLTVESETGKGSCFILELPLKKANPIEQSHYEEVLPSKPESTVHGLLSFGGGKTQILIVEDNEEMAQFLRRILSPHYDCTLAPDGKAALKLLEVRASSPLTSQTSPLNPDLILSDVMMPNMDGFTFLQNIKANKAFRQTPTILLTARALPEDRLRGLCLGVDDYITKPFRTEELLARIANLLENKKQREEWLAEHSDAPTDGVELSHEEQLLNTAEEQVLAHLSDANYSVDELCRDLNYSRRQTERLLKKLTGLTPLAFIREIRLRRAEHYLLHQKFPTVAEVAFEVGFEDPGYFTKVFAKRFGRRPSEV